MCRKTASRVRRESVIHPAIVRLVRFTAARSNTPSAPWPSDLSTSACQDALDTHGLTASLYPALHRTPGTPADLLQWARDAHEHALMARDYCVLRLAQLRSVLCDRGPVVLVQGAALWESTYAPPRARSVSDIDIVLPGASMERLRSALEALGFAPVLHYSDTLSDGTLSLDLHAGFWGEDRLPLRARLGLPTVVPTVPSALFAGYQVPSAEYAGLLCCYHAVKHGFSRLVWDLDACLLHADGPLDAPEYAGPTARRIVDMTRRRLVGLGLVPDAPSTRPRRTVGRLIEAQALRAGQRTGSGELLLALCCAWPMLALRLIAASLVPPAATLRAMYGQHSYPALLARRALSLLRLAGRVA